jgi:RNA polymerase sigma factor (sigma-70 family)
MTETEDVAVLLQSAASGEQQAWDRLVDRYMSLVISVIRKYRLSDKDAEDVSQTVWLRLVEYIDRIREPHALPGWITTTTKNEALRLLKAKSLVDPTDPSAGGPLDVDSDSLDVDDSLLRQERHRAILAGLAELAPNQRQLLELLVADPPVSYQDISRLTGMPVGSIGPTRARCLARLRATSPVQALLSTENSANPGGGRQ